MARKKKNIDVVVNETLENNSIEEVSVKEVKNEVVVKEITMSKVQEPITSNYIWKNCKY